MKRIFIFIAVLLLLSCCVYEEKDTFTIYASFILEEVNDRNGEDYIKLWVNDTLLFSGTYYTNYVESTMTNLDDAVCGMRLADIERYNRDSLKIRIRAVSLDSVLFGDKRVMDSTFRYRIDNIPGMTILDTRLFPEENRGSFYFLDPVSHPFCWQVD